MCASWRSSASSTVAAPSRPPPQPCTSPPRRCPSSWPRCPRRPAPPMLEPDGRRVRLTEAAQLLLRHAHQIFTHLEHAESDLAAFRRGDAGTVRVGTFSSAVKALAVPVISDLATRTRTPGRDARGGARGRAGCPAGPHRRRLADPGQHRTAARPGRQAGVHRAPAGRRQGRRAAFRPSAGRSGRDRTGRPGGRRLDPGPSRRALLAAGPGRLRAGRFPAAGPALRGRVRRRRRADRGRARGEPAAPAGPAGVRATSRSCCGRSPA